ncbi:MAG: Vps62-related protein [Arenicellales bacterium]
MRRKPLQPLRHVKAQMVGLLLFAGMVYAAPAQAEQSNIPRVHPFNVGLPSPKCDGIEDIAEDFADFIVDGVEYMGEQVIENAIGIAELIATGDPDRLVDHINKTFEDLASAAGTVLDFTPLGLMSVLVDQLPAGVVGDFISDGVKFSEQFVEAAVVAGVAGANPITLAEKANGDFGEIFGDITNLLGNLDDPLSFGNEFLKLNQKWTGVGALTYMFTEKDPMTGLRKAIKAIERQAEILSYASPIPKIDLVSALKKHAKKESLKYIKNLALGDDPEQAKVATILLATFETAIETALLDPNYNFSSSNSRHPMYMAKPYTLFNTWMGSSYPSGGHYDFSLNKVQIDSGAGEAQGCISLGDSVTRTQAVDPSKQLGLYFSGGSIDVNLPSGNPIYPPGQNAICGVADARGDWWERPIDFKLIWGDNCSGGTRNKSVWQPVCPDGYVGVGFVSSDHLGVKPLPSDIACLKADPNLLEVVDGEKAGLQFFANDSQSGSKFNITFYTREFLGMQLMHAVPNITPRADADTFRKTLRVAVPAKGVPPSGFDTANGGKSHCVNFYSDSAARGWTHEECDLDGGTQSVRGSNNQLLSKMDSFHCGEEVAGVEFWLEELQQAFIFKCPFRNSLNHFNIDKVKIHSSYTDPRSGELILSPKTLADNKAAAQKAERDRLELIRVTEILTVQNPEFRAKCEDPNEASAASYCHALAIRYRDGTPPLAQDYVEALNLLEKACAELDGPASCTEWRNVALKYGPEDLNGGSGRAYRDLGRIYDYGYYAVTGSPTAEERARNLYELACLSDEPDAQGCRLHAFYLEHGLGGNVDLEGALYYYEESCRLFNRYGCLYAANVAFDGNYNGSLALRDLDLAMGYYVKACGLGILDGCAGIEKVGLEWEKEAAAAIVAQLEAEKNKDTDEDGMPDRWEQIYFLDPLYTGDAAEDANKDGVTNLEEYQRGSNPLEESSLCFPVKTAKAISMICL